MKKLLLVTFLAVSILQNIFAQLSINAGNDVSLCTGTSANIGTPTGASGGTAPYHYQWYPSSGLNSDTVSFPLVSNISSTTTYMLFVTDALGDTATDFVVVNVLPPVVLNAGNSQSICAGNCVALGGSPTATGGTPPYIYIWAPGAGLNSTTLANPTACPGTTTTYTLTVADAQGCTATTGVSVNVNAAVLSSAAVQPSTVCAGDTLFTTANATGGSAPYTYLWWGPGGYTSNTQSGAVYNVSAISSGSYMVTVTDANGCSASAFSTASVVTCGNNAIASTTNVICAGTSTGSIDITVTGGNPPYSYLWNNSATTEDLNNLSVGTYSVTISDQSGPYDTLVVNITEPSPMVATAFATNGVSCFGNNDGTIQVVATGGSGSYTYLWNTGFIGQVHTGLAAGAYTVTVLDANGCTTTATAFVTQPTQIFGTASTTPSLCGSCNGSVAATVSGGTSPYTYVWSNAVTVLSFGNACAGNYNLTVADANNCTASINAAVSNDTTGSFSISVSSTGYSCMHPLDTLTVTLTGGTQFAINWGDGLSSWGFLNVFDHVYNLPGTYTISVTDSSTGCTQYFNHVLPANSISIGASETIQPTCGNPNTGKIKVAVNGGSAPYTFAWSNGATADSIVNVTAGTYVVTVTDNGGCQNSQTFVLNQTNSLVTTAYCSSSAGCNGQNGTATVAVTGGTPPYIYLWGTTPPQTAPVASGLSIGSYGYTVTDNAGCTTSGSVYVYNYSSFYAYVQPTYPNCAANGSATVYPYNGTAPYTYLWNTNPPQTTQTAVGLQAGSYQVTVTDANGCVQVAYTTLYNHCMNVITGTVVNDVNGNCTLDNGETYFNTSVYAVSSTGTTYYGYMYYGTGEYTIEVPAGTYTIYPYLYNGCIQPCSGTGTITHTFPTVGDTLSNTTFYLVQAPFDLYAYTWPGNFRPGFYRTAYLYYGNVGTNAVNGTLEFTYDADVTFVAASAGAVHDVPNRKLTWTHNNIPGMPYNYYNLWDTVRFYTPINTPINTPLNFSLRISGPANECDTADNYYYANSWVSNSYDPNLKEVFPADYLLPGDSLLTYTIHFQNTGNDTAFFIIVRDTLSNLLDAATVRTLETSHPLTEFSIGSNGELAWVFNPIYLPDSTTNQEGSNGHITFTVKKKADVPLQTEIPNTASIYFDYNQPVQTNTATLTYGEPLSVWSVSKEHTITAIAYPNPFSHSTQVVVEGLNEKFDVELFDITGQLQKKITSVSNNRFELERGQLASGIYFCKIMTNKKQVALVKLAVE